MGCPSDHRSDRVLTLTWSRYDSASLTLRGRRLLLPPACCCCQVGEGRFGGMLWDMVGGVGRGRGGEGDAWAMEQRVGNENEQRMELAGRVVAEQIRNEQPWEFPPVCLPESLRHHFPR